MSLVKWTWGSQHERQYTILCSSSVYCETEITKKQHLQLWSLLQNIELSKNISPIVGRPMWVARGELQLLGKGQQFFPTIALLESKSNHYPERCFNNMEISQKGNYTQWLGHSCLYVKAFTSSWTHCQIPRMEIILINHMKCAWIGGP